MYIDGNLIPLFAIAVGLIIAVTRILTSTISNHKLKVEQIRAEAMVRAEEIRARNQLELERLMRQDQVNMETGPLNRNESFEGNTENVNSKSRVRE